MAVACTQRFGRIPGCLRPGGFSAFEGLASAGHFIKERLLVE